MVLSISLQYSCKTNTSLKQLGTNNKCPKPLPIKSGSKIYSKQSSLYDRIHRDPIKLVKLFSRMMKCNSANNLSVINLYARQQKISCHCKYSVRGWSVGNLGNCCHCQSFGGGWSKQHTVINSCCWIFASRVILSITVRWLYLTDRYSSSCYGGFGLTMSGAWNSYYFFCPFFLRKNNG